MISSYDSTVNEGEVQAIVPEYMYISSFPEPRYFVGVRERAIGAAAAVEAAERVRRRSQLASEYVGK